MRLGRNERWILTHCHLKGIGRLPNGWKIPRSISSSVVRSPRFTQYLFKSEIMLNLFELIPVSTPGQREQTMAAGYFRDSGLAKATYGRTKRTLVEKGLIEVEAGTGPNAERLRLSPKGRTCAEELLRQRQR